MNILYYYWTENSDTDIEQTFQSLGHHYSKISYPLNSYDFDESFETQMHALLAEYQFDIIFTFNYFPILSKIALAHEIPYVSWVYDCPNLTIYSTTIANECNYLFLFDKELLATAQAMGAKHAFHLPLAVNTSRLNTQLQLSNNNRLTDFSYDVSFVGSLYEKNMYNQVTYLPEYLKGYFEGVISSQQKIQGYSLIGDVLTDSIVSDALKYIQLENDPNYRFTPKQILTNMLNQKITSEERIHLLAQIAARYPLDLFTGSENVTIKNSRTHGFISYTDEMPNVFCHSKINLNISLRSITSGIPLRCMDILGAGGFLLSNYQPELAELFAPDEEFSYYTSEEDMLARIDYFLCHKNDRIEIAHNGWKKVQNEYSYEKQLRHIISIVTD